MRHITTFSVIVEMVLFCMVLGCNKTSSTDDDTDPDNPDNLTACQQAVLEWNDIWAVSTEETGLADDTPENDLMDIWGSGPEDIYVVGFKGTILHFNGTTWTKMDSGTIENLRGVWGYVLKDQNDAVLRTDIFATGENGTILRFNGTTWQKQLVFFTDPARNNIKSTVTDDFSDISGIPAAGVNDEPTVIAVGAEGLIVAYDEVGNTFEEMRQQVTIQHADPDPPTTEYHRWTQDQLNGVFGVSAGDFVAVGNMGTVLNIDATNLGCARVFVLGLSTHLNGVWGRWGELYSVGNEGTVIRRRSGNWSTLSLDLPKTYLRSTWSVYQEQCGEIPEGGTEADRPTTSWRVYVGWEGTLYLDHDGLLCPLDTITPNRLEAVWGTMPRSLAERSTTTDVNGVPTTTWVCDPMEILIAGVDGTLIRLTNQEGL